MYLPFVAAKPNDVDSHAWLTDVLVRIAGHLPPQFHLLLP
jgi:hypothetical protein